MRKYMEANAMYNSLVHFLIGLGVGVLITYPYIGIHPVRVGGLLVAVGLAMHLYPLVAKK